jgi:hypothetical protein
MNVIPRTSLAYGRSARAGITDDSPRRLIDLSRDECEFRFINLSGADGLTIRGLTIGRQLFVLPDYSLR